MAERGTFLGEFEVAARGAGRRFWALPWKYKGSAMGVGALLLLGAATSGGGSDDGGKESAKAFSQVDAGETPVASLVPFAGAAATDTPAPPPAPTDTPAPTATPVPPTDTPTSEATPEPTAAPPTAPPAAQLACEATASVSNAAPAQNSNVAVTGVLSCANSSPEGARMSTSWAYKSSTSSCDAVADAGGVAQCTRNISRATAGYTVRITVTFTLEGQTFRATTGFTPQ